MSTAANPALVEPGTPFGPYRIVRELGRGGMGTVYLAEVVESVLAADAADEVSHEASVEIELPAPGTLVALKSFHPHLVSTKDFARRFRREARSGAAIRHPNVVRTFDAGTAPLLGRATNYLAMEYVEGQTLRDLIREMGRLPEELARTVARQVASALDAIHGAGITHRDLKPENVVITRDHHVKLMDLGVAKVREESIRLSLTGQFLGSVHYASPEQFRSPDSVDHRADLYALGVLLYEMLAGENPFFHDDLRVVLRKTLGEMPRRLSLFVENASPVLDQLSRSLMEKGPADRVQTAAEVLDVLEHGDDSVWWREAGRRLWAQSAGRVVRRLAVAREVPLAGREAELRELRHQFDRAAAGERRIVLLEGEAGSGKTRLVDEFASGLAEQGVSFQFLFGVAPAPGTARPFHVFCEAIRQAISPEDPRTALAALLPPGSPVDEFAAFVSATPGAEMPAERAQSLFAAAFRALAAREPVLLVLDDMHLAGDASARLFAYLQHDDRSTPLLVIACHRPTDETSPLHAIVHGGRDPNVVAMVLGRLGPREIGQILRNTLKSERLVQELGFRLLETTEGNPLFLLEVIRTLQQDRVLRLREDGAWTMSGTRIEMHVPASVRDLVATQVARVSDEDREVLDVAAVMGPEFDPEVLAEVLGQPKIGLLKRLSVLERRHHLIRAVGRRCRFDHQQLRETLYEGVMEGLREEYHAQIGDALARRRAASKAPPDAGAHLELLHHFAFGARPDRAAEHVVPALRHAAATYQAERGAILAGRFLAAAGGDSPAALTADVRVLLAGFLEHEGRRDEERTVLDAARADAERANDSALLRRVLERSLLLSFAVGDFAAAERACRASFRLATRRDDRHAALTDLVTLAGAHRCLGRYEEAAKALHRALKFVIARESTVRRAIVLASLAGIENQRGRRRTAQRLFLEAATIAKAFGAGKADDLAETALAGHDELRERFLGLSRALGRTTEARIDGERTVLLGAEMPRRLREGGALLALAGVATDLGMADDARTLLLRALSAARESSDARFEATVLHALGESALESRAPGVAAKWLNEALELRRRIGHRPGVCETLLALGQVAALGGSVDAARRALEEATELAPELGMPAIAALARAASALLLAREGLPDRARTELAHARAALDAPGPLSIASRVEGLYFSALAARALGDEPSARQHLEHAWEVLRDIAAPMSPDERRAFLFERSPNREIVEACGGGAR